MKTNKFFGFDEKVGHWVAMALMAIIGLIACGEILGLWDDRYEELKKSHREEVNLLQLQNEIHLRKINELKEQLRDLKSEIEIAKPKEEAKSVAASPSSESAGKLESTSNQDWQTMVLKNADPVDRKMLEDHFKQENEFKASLNQAQKKEFDTEVEKAYAHLLANSGVEGELSDLQKQATRRNAETIAMTMVKTEWQSRDFLNRWNAKNAALEEESEDDRRQFYEELEENIRLIHDEFGLPPFDWGLIEEIEAELSPDQKEEMEEEFAEIAAEVDRQLAEMLKEKESE